MSTSNLSRQFLFTDFPQLQRFGVGFDRLTDILSNTVSQQGNYPPHNIVKYSETEFEIELAVAGFLESELDIKVENNTITVTGTVTKTESAQTYIHHGIGMREFIRQFTINETMSVKGASLKNGILAIKLEKQLPIPPESVKITIMS